MSESTPDTSAADVHAEPEPRVGPTVDEVDAEVRAKLMGHSVATIADQAEAAFATIGVQLAGEQLLDYANAVNSGLPFPIEHIPVEHIPTERIAEA